VPPGCSIHLEKQTMAAVLKNIKAAYANLTWTQWKAAAGIVPAPAVALAAFPRLGCPFCRM